MTTELSAQTVPPSPDHAPPSSPSRRGGRGARELVARFALFVVFAGLIVVFAILRPDTFATSDNVQIIINQSAVLAIFGCAVTLVLLSGEFDLAFPNIADSVAVTVGVALTAGGLSSLLGVTAALLLGVVLSVVLGLASGLFLAIGKVPSFVATLAVGSVAAGIELATQGRITGGLKQISTLDLPASLQNAGTSTLPGTSLRYGVLVAIVVVLVVWFIVKFTVFGRHVQAIGANADAAYLASVPVNRVRVIVFALSGLIAGIGGIVGLLQRGYFNGASPPLLLQAYTVAFLGTAVLAAGRFTIWGSMIAVLFLQVLANGLGLLNQPTWIVSIVNGTVLLVAVVLTRRRA